MIQLNLSKLHVTCFRKKVYTLGLVFFNIHVDQYKLHYTAKLVIKK